LYTTNTKHAFYTSILACGRLVACLFFGVVAREIMLDCNDVDCDNKTGIATIPVKYGCGRASAVSLLATLCMSATAMSQPLYHILKEYTQTSVSMGNVFKSHPIQTRRLWLALTASIIMVRRSWQVFQTRGKNPQVNSTAVDESVLTVVFLLASFI
jgi:4-hydroxybenzoate polyprenyltransferase